MQLVAIDTRFVGPGTAALAAVLVLLVLGGPAMAADAPAQFDRDIRPLLETYCSKCHGAVKPKKGVNLVRFADVRSVQREPKLWREVLSQLNDRNMPPDGKPQPSDEQRARLIEWVQYTLTHFEPGTFAQDPGRPTIRRLNRLEYNNTVRDLFGVAVRPADTFPADAGGGAGFDNNADALFVPPILLERYLAAADAVLKEARYGTIAVAEASDKLPRREAAKKCIDYWAFRAFRRPVSEDELEPYLKLYDAAQERGDSYFDSLKLALKAMLVSPNFLFRVERDRDGTEPWAVNDYELASRLSYFLWSSMPDPELFDLAKAGKLHETEVLEAQTRRMLKDPKSKALAEGFGTQWLGVRELLTTAQPDPNRFPKFTASVRYSMYDEAVLFVDSVFRDDAPLTRLIDADYTYANDWLTELYGIKDRIGGGDGKGEVMRRIKLDDPNRGGILGLGAVLTVTSYPLRTSPVLRGKWVLERVLGAPPPPPPPEVPELPKDDGKKDGLTFRQQLELHRKSPQCASCHNRMDPLGLGLENFDPIGRWRTEVAGSPVDSSGVTPAGESFQTPAELKKVLLSHKAEFVRNVTEKMLGYALGRGLEYYDQPTVQAICDSLQKNDDRSSTLILEIVKSYPFRYRRNATADDAGSKDSATDGRSEGKEKRTMEAQRHGGAP
jgi:hypothetical protein